MKLNSFYEKLRMEEPGGPSGAGDGGAPAEPPAEAPPAADLSFIPEDYHTDGKPDVGKFATHYSELMARDAQAAERAANVPEDGVYDFTLPENMDYGDLQLPEGVQINLMTDDETMKPLFAELGSFLKDLGAPKEMAGKAAGLIAKYEATKLAQAVAAQKADAQALGTPAQAQARISGVARLLDAKLPANMASALKAATTSAAGVQALERLLAPRALGAPPSPPPGEDTSNMTPAERLAYANRKAAEAS